MYVVYIRTGLVRVLVGHTRYILSLFVIAERGCYLSGRVLFVASIDFFVAAYNTPSCIVWSIG